MPKFFAPFFLVQVLVSAFLAVLFLQSGIDKIVDWKGNLEWLKSHFGKSPLRRMVPLLFLILTIIEVSAGALNGAGLLMLLFVHKVRLAFYGAIISAIAICCLFFGQRMAKEYAGAAVLVPYFLLTLLAIYLFGH